MRILQVISSLSPASGGPAQAVLELSEALISAGQNVSIYATDYGLANSNAFLKKICDRGISIELFKSSLGRYCYAPSLAKRLKEKIQEFDVVHIHGLWTFPIFIASRMCQTQGVPYLVRPCGMLDPYCLKHHRMRKKVYYLLREEKTLRNAAAIQFTTEEEKERSIRDAFCSKSVVVPLGLNLEPYLQTPPQGSFRKRLPETGNQKIILFLGRLSFKKGLDFLIRAFTRLAKKRDDIHLVIAGPDDENYGKYLTRWIEEGNIGNRVTRIGFVEGVEKLSLFLNSDLFCLLSHQENFGLAVLEAMAAGLPVVVSPQVNLAAEIRRHEAGLVTSLEDEKVEEAISRLLGDAALRREMGRRGRQFVRETYSWDRVLDAWLQLYERVLSDRCAEVIK